MTLVLPSVFTAALCFKCECMYVMKNMKRDLEVGVLKRFPGSWLTGIGRLIEELRIGKSVSVLVPVPTFYIKPVPILTGNRITIQFYFYNLIY